MAIQDLPHDGTTFALDFAEPDRRRWIHYREMQLGNRHGCFVEIPYPTANRRRADRVPPDRRIADCDLPRRRDPRAVCASLRRHEIAGRVGEDSAGLCRENTNVVERRLVLRLRYT